MNDWRNIRNGNIIPTVGYCDQPYLVTLPNGGWLCALTTAAGHEGAHGEFVGVTRSADRGRTWTPLLPLEDPDGPESCYSVPLVTPSGRVYVFYNYNGDNVRAPKRSDELGWFVFRYSDDGGASWSERFRLPMRMTRCDRENTFAGRVQLFWCISHAVVTQDDVYIAFTKMRTYVQEDNEGWVFRSPNLLRERDPGRIRWELLPEGDDGIRAPELGSVQEEHNIVALGDGSLYCMYRTATGHPAFSISRDGARSWSPPEIARYADGRPIKTPRACPMMWRLANGRYLFWYHNNSIPGWGGRNPVWIAGGTERDGGIAWSQPEILFYDPDENLGMSYPDLVESDGEFFFSHTQKTVARVVRADPALLEALWGQGNPAAGPVRRGLRLESGPVLEKGAAVAADLTVDLSRGQGFSVDLRFLAHDLAPGQVLLDARDARGVGFAVTIAARGTVAIGLCDRSHGAFWECDEGLLKPGREHRVAFLVDGGPKTISVVVDG
ncbi:MAG: exo-alpha-sialidase, partial [Lentisphaeria bacterium]|nr:exo-alpha-sialidase [Lentisphaeria bacterium]